jgi:hypothetical protein
MRACSAEVAAQSLRDLPRLCKTVQQATCAEGVTVLQNNEASAGQEVFHAHFHVIPRMKGDKLVGLPKSAPEMISTEAATEMLAKFAAADPGNRRKKEGAKKPRIRVFRRGVRGSKLESWKKLDEICENYLAGRCRNTSEQCRRIHQGDIEQRIEKIDEVCNNFLEGRCRFGDLCRRQHPAQ